MKNNEHAMFNRFKSPEEKTLNIKIGIII